MALFNHISTTISLGHEGDQYSIVFTPITDRKKFVSVLKGDDPIGCHCSFWGSADVPTATHILAQVLEGKPVLSRTEYMKH